MRATRCCPLLARKLSASDQFSLRIRTGLLIAADNVCPAISATINNPSPPVEIKKGQALSQIRKCRGKMTQKIGEKSYQPVSRILFRVAAAAIIYLAPALLQESSCLPSGAHLSRSASGEPPSVTGIRGISACKVYPPRRLPAGAVGSYPTFSTSLRRSGAVIFCGTICERFRAPRLLTGALPCAVRTFLPPKRRAMTRLVASAKVKNLAGSSIFSRIRRKSPLPHIQNGGHTG